MDERAAGQRAAASGAGPRRVLIVDDNEDIRGLLRLQVDGLGSYDVVGEACDGEEAVRLASALQPHLVLLDLSMPSMDGLQALPLILAAVPEVRVIVMSGFGEGSMAETALAAGAHRYLEKGMRMNLAAALDGAVEAG